MSLSLVTVRPIVCWPWHLRFLVKVPVVGEACTFCGRDVAAPVATHKAPQACLYCALDRGEIEAVEQPIEGTTAFCAFSQKIPIDKRT